MYGIVCFSYVGLLLNLFHLTTLLPILLIWLISLTTQAHLRASSYAKLWLRKM